MRSTSVISLVGDAPKFCVVNLGCKVNRVESDTIAAALSARGGTPVSQEDATLIVVNTCTVTGEADKKARKAVRHALSAAPHSSVVVTGCAVAVDAEAYAALGERVAVIQRADLLVQLSETAEGLHAGSELRFGDDFRTRVGIKAQDGCNHACTYCIVHVARGRATSMPYRDVLAEADRYFERGVKEIVLTGIDLGSYRDGSWRLHHLAAELIEHADRLAPAGELPARVRASSLEPHSVSNEFLQLLATSGGRLCRHVHLPLQSGSSKVLREMARTYDATQYLRLVEKMRSCVPELSLTTDIICGFPGESASDFEETLAVARACGFSKIHVFPYSKRSGTPAAARTDQVSADAKAQRCSQLRALSDELRLADLRSRAGAKELAVVEGATMLTESYHELDAPKGAIPGSLVSVTF